jgi:hypothetical protein
VGVRDTGIFEGTRVDGLALIGLPDLAGMLVGVVVAGDAVLSVGEKVCPYFEGTRVLAAERGADDGATEVG